MTTPPGQMHGKPLDVFAEAGLVIADDAGVAVSMTADCAEETGGRLIAAADEARMQTRRSET